ncbi:hypothetical protein [Burkholderia glumae]
MAELRCRPGDLARIIKSNNPMAVGRIVIVDRFDDEHGRWLTTLLGEPILGIGILSGRPKVSSKLFFADSSLAPLRDDEQYAIERETEACHD